jgi:formylmethanofuran dehydrogenase subunit D
MAIDIGKFIKSPEYDITIVTYRDVFQAPICEEDRFGSECREMSAVIILDNAEMKHMGISNESNVFLKSKSGSVVVKAQASPKSEQKGIGFMVNSPWSNALVSDETTCGIPEYKNIHVKITTTKEELTTLDDLLAGL